VVGKRLKEMVDMAKYYRCVSKNMLEGVSLPFLPTMNIVLLCTINCYM